MIKKAFTLLELVIVIVIFGIIASIGTDITMNLYTNYILSRNQNEYEEKLDIATQQIALRLKYAIKDSIVIKESFADLPKTLLDYQSDNIIIYEWVGKDHESFRGIYDNHTSTTPPGWSGFVDLNASSTNATQIKSSGSYFNDVNTTIIELSQGTKTITDAVIIFNGASGDSLNGYGFDYISHNRYKAFPITNIISNDTISFINTSQPLIDRISEKYDLAWTAYALVLEGASDHNRTLKLYYNYQPWNGDTYLNANSSILIENVSNFYMTMKDKSLHFQLCLKDSLYLDNNNTKRYCQERGVY